MSYHHKLLPKQPGKTPLPQSFFLLSIVGCIVSGWYTFTGAFDPSWGFAFLLVFILMFIASFVSMTPSENEPL